MAEPDRDPILDELRAAKAAYAARFDGDTHAMFEDLRRRGETGRERAAAATERPAARRLASSARRPAAPRASS